MNSYQLLYCLLVLAIAVFSIITIIYCNPLKTYYIIHKKDFYARGLNRTTKLGIFKELAYSAFYRELQNKVVPQVGDIVINTINFSNRQSRVVERIFLLDKNRQIPVLLLEDMEISYQKLE